MRQHRWTNNVPSPSLWMAMLFLQSMVTLRLTQTAFLGGLDLGSRSLVRAQLKVATLTLTSAAIALTFSPVARRCRSRMISALFSLRLASRLAQ